MTSEWTLIKIHFSLKNTPISFWVSDFYISLKLRILQISTPHSHFKMLFSNIEMN